MSASDLGFLRDPPTQELRYTLISADDHLVEPPDMFDGRLPTHLADRAPRVVTLNRGDRFMTHREVIATKDDRQAWEYEGQLFVQPGLNAVAGYEDWKELRSEPTSFADVRPGCYDIEARIKDMDIGGIWASANFPSQITGFAGVVYSRSKDPELGQAVMRAWNDWLFEEWHSPYPERIIPLGITWLADPTIGAAEIRRNAARGFTAVTLPEQPHRLGFPALHTGYWDPILAACEETDTAVCLHVGSSGMVDLPEGGSKYEKNVTLFPALSLAACVEWLWSGIPLRFPGLKIVMSEGGIGWVPMLFDRLDYMMERAGRLASQEWIGDLMPAELLARNFYFCMLDDPSALPVVHRIGVDHVMIEVDYPHSDSTWPRCQDILHQRFTEHAATLSADDVAWITHRTAATVFRHPLPVTAPDLQEAAR